MHPTLNQIVQTLYIALAAFALGKALFRSFWATEFKNRMMAKDKQAYARIAVLRWELANRIKYSPEAAQRKPHAARIDLTADELDARRRELESFVGATLWKRCLTYFLGCVFCQSFWAGVIITVCWTGSVNLIDSLIAGTVGYLLAERIVQAGPTPLDHRAVSGCPTCGKENQAALRSRDAALGVASGV